MFALPQPPSYCQVNHRKRKKEMQIKQEWINCAVFFKKVVSAKYLCMAEIKCRGYKPETTDTTTCQAVIMVRVSDII